ncbi:zinc ribbon domain-containing protein [Streptomyces inhibens]|uniref:zinc ribbon domain-containing protein n=1 Tax=Streptomyces inhibens TaxID=2293571 RepID=UPI00378BD3F6
MLVGRRYQLVLEGGQAEMCEEFGNLCRAVWNTGLEQRREYRRRGAWVSYVQQAREMAEAKADHPWLKAAPSHILQQTLRDLTAAAKGTLAEPGTGVRQKAGLNRAILDKGWHGFELAVRNKARATGCLVRTVNPACTSQTCPACGAVDANSRKSQAEFACTRCGYTGHADTVGAKNTLARGHAGHRAWRPRGCPVREAPTSVKPQGMNAPAGEVGIPQL